jgi:hypothetical protein
MCLQYILIRFTPSITLLYPPFLEQFQQVLLFYFHIWIQNASTIFTLIHLFLLPSPLLLVLLPFYLPILHFLKVYIECPRELHLVISNLYISCFNQITALFYFLSLVPCSPIFSTTFSELCCIIFIHR